MTVHQPLVGGFERPGSVSRVVTDFLISHISTQPAVASKVAFLNAAPVILATRWPSREIVEIALPLVVGPVKRISKFELWLPPFKAIS